MLLSSSLLWALTIAVGMVTAADSPQESHVAERSDDAKYSGGLFDKAMKILDTLEPNHSLDKKRSTDQRDQSRGALDKALHSILSDDELKQIDGTLDLLADKVGHLVSRDVGSEDSGDRDYPPDPYGVPGPYIPIGPKPFRPLPVVDTDVNDDGLTNAMDMFLKYREFLTGEIDRNTFVDFLNAYEMKIEKTMTKGQTSADLMKLIKRFYHDLQQKAENSRAEMEASAQKRSDLVEDFDDKDFPPDMGHGPVIHNDRPLPKVDLDVNHDGLVSTADLMFKAWEYMQRRIDRDTYLKYIEAYKEKMRKEPVKTNWPPKIQAWIDRLLDFSQHKPLPAQPEADASHLKRSDQADIPANGGVRWERKPPVVVQRLPCDCKNVIQSILEPKPKEGMTHEWYEGWTKKFYSQLRWREECFELCVDEAMNDFLAKLKWLRTHDPRLKIKPNQIAPEPKDPVKEVAKNSKRSVVEDPNVETHTFRMAKDNSVIELEGMILDEVTKPRGWPHDQKRDSQAKATNFIQPYRDWWLTSHKTGKFCNCKAEQDGVAAWSWVSAMPKSNKRCAKFCKNLANVPGLEKPNGTVTVPIYKGRPQVPADGHFDPAPEPNGPVNVPFQRGPNRPADAAADIVVPEKTEVDQPAPDGSA